MDNEPINTNPQETEPVPQPPKRRGRPPKNPDAIAKRAKEDAEAAAAQISAAPVAEPSAPAPAAPAPAAEQTPAPAAEEPAAGIKEGAAWAAHGSDAR